MKIVTKEYYEVRPTEMGWKFDEKFEQLDDAVAFAEERSVRPNGSKKTLIVVRVAWARQFDDNGIFEFEDTHEQRVCII